MCIRDRWCHVTIHGKDTIGHHQHPSGGSFQKSCRRFDITMRKHRDLGTGEPAAIDDRGVVEPIGQHGIARLEQCCECSDVGQVTGAKQHAVRAAFERGQPLFEPLVQFNRTTE